MKPKTFSFHLEQRKLEGAEISLLQLKHWIICKITTFPGSTKKVEVAGQPMNSGFGGKITAFKEKWNASASQHMPGAMRTRNNSAENVNKLLKASCGPPSSTVHLGATQTEGICNHL